MSKANIAKSLLVLLTIPAGVGGILHARVNLGMSERDLSAWLAAGSATMAWGAAVLWVAVIWLFVQRRVLG